MKLPTRQDILQEFIPTQHSSFMWEGESDKPVFIFIHGFATFIDDLIPLALAFRQDGYTCDLLALKGHGSNLDNLDDLNNSSYSDWYSQVSKAYLHHKENGKKVYLIGFSLGALLSIDFAKENNVDGIIGISSFLGASPRLKLIYPLFKKFPNFKYPRYPQVTSKSTRKELLYNKQLTLRLSEAVLLEAKRVKMYAYTIKSPVLLLHSVDDKVSDYKATAEMYHALHHNSQLVTFRVLNHFLQFDIPSMRVKDLVLVFLQLKQIPENEFSTDEMLQEAYIQVSEESREWAGNIFNLVVGFFSLFGALLFFSFDVLAEIKPQAPYYAILYSLSASIYLTLLLLYFFYLNRSLAYTKHYIEPSLTFMGWVSYKSYKWLAGRESLMITGLVSVLLLLLVPATISIASIIYGIHYFPDRFLSFAVENIFLQVIFGISIFMLFFNGVLAYLIQKSSKSELHGGIIRAMHTSKSFEKLLMELYASVKPGIVKQLWSHTRNTKTSM